MDLVPLCQRAVVAVDAGRTLRETAQTMFEHHVGAVVVTRAAGEVVGLVTDRDLTLACVARALDPAAVLVGAIVQGPPVSVPASHTPAQAADAMQAAGVRRLLVRHLDGTVVGLLSSDDLLPALIAPLQALASSFGAGIERERGRGHDGLYDSGATLTLRPLPEMA